MQKTDYWEPPDLVAKLTVGTRVRYRVSSECPFICPLCGGNLHHTEVWGNSGEGVLGKRKEHSSFMHTSYEPIKAEGCGALKLHPESMDAHKFYVRMGGGRGFWAAAVELTVLEDDDADTTQA